MLDNLFNLKTVAISHFVSRSGTLYLHSLLDDHPEIITIPATIEINCFFKNNKNLNAEELYDIFEKNNPLFFDTSKYSFLDRHNSKLYVLGENKKDKILTNKESFKKNFLSLLKNKKKDPENILKSIYIAYAITHNKNLNQSKLILFHPHEKKNTLLFNNFFKDAIYLIPLRNPLNSYKSIINKSRKINKARNLNYYPSGQLIESALDINDFYKKKMKMYFIKIEDFKDKKKQEMIKLSNFLEIKFDNKMMNSTFGGLKYWGNNPDQDYEGFNVKSHLQIQNLSRNDQIILSTISGQFMKALNYPKIQLSKIEKFFLYFKVLMPLEDEIKFIKDLNIKNIHIYLKFFIIYLPKRLVLIILIILNKFSKRYKLLK